MSPRPAARSHSLQTGAKSNRFAASALCSLCLVAALLGAATVSAQSFGVQRQLPDPHGARLQLVTATAAQSAAAPNANGPPRVSPSGDATAQQQAFQEQLRLLTRSTSPYDPAWEEPLWGMGRLALEAGDAESARQYFTRALQVLRVNDGLYAARQRPLLRELLALSRGDGDWEALDGLHRYYYRLHGSGQGDFNAENLAATLGYFEWQREAIQRASARDARRKLLELHDFGGDMIMRLQQTAAANVAPGWRQALREQQLATLYLLLSEEIPSLYDERGRPMRPLMTDAMGMPDMDTERLFRLQQGADGEARRLLLPSAEPADVAAAVVPMAGDSLRQRARNRLLLGDWLFWRGRRSEALEQYRSAQARLRDAGLETLAQQWFGEPREIPTAGLLAGSEPGQASPAMLLRFDVSATGRARNVEVLQANQGSGGLSRRLRDLRFRPRMVDGEAVATAGIERSYREVSFR